jgi:hypothetical protein
MGYEIALNKAWNELEKLSPPSKYTLLFLTDIYEVDVSDRIVLSQLSQTLAKEDISILIIHYLIGIRKYGYGSSGEWISFKEIQGGNVFYPAFHECTIKPLAESFQRDPEGFIMNLTEHFRGRIVESGDVAIELTTFPDVDIRMIFWRGDEDFSPEATILFDRNLSRVYTTEDIAVFLLIAVRNIIGYG